MNVKKIISFSLVLVIVLSSLVGCSKEITLDEKIVAYILCEYDKNDINVTGIEKMDFSKDETEGMCYYFVSVTIESDDGEYEDVFSYIWLPYAENLPGKTSSKNDSTLGDGTYTSYEFTYWEEKKDNPGKQKVTTFSEDEVKSIVENAWEYIEKNNIHTEE